MKNILRKTYVLLCASFTFLLFGCAELLDCVASTRPNLHSKSLYLGTVGNSYSDFIEADVTNDANDNDYNYYFSVTGNLPPGIRYYEQGRKIFFNGNPNQAGTFTFRVRLTINAPDYYDSNQGFFEDGNRICFGDDTTTKVYTIVIQ